MRKVETSSGKNLSVAIQVSCAAIIAAFMVLGLFVLFLAGGIADTVRLEAENKLVANEIDRQIQLLARDQSQISYWDKTVEAIADRIDPDFVDEEMAGWLWEDFGIETTIVVSGDGRPRVVVEQNRVLEPQEGLAFVTAAGDLISAARRAYLRQRRATDGGYIVAGHPLHSGSKMFVSDIRPVNGQMSLIVAQAIVPDEDEVLPEGAPQVLLTFKPLSSELLQTMARTLGLSDFRIVIQEDRQADLATMQIGHGIAGKPIMAEWQSAAPSNTIWSMSAIPVLALLALVAGTLMFVARRSAVALRALETSEQQNRFLALHDALTGLPNRVQFDQALEETISKGRHDRCSILCIDLDRFKAVNDSFGHQAGDVVIKTVADRIAKTVGEAGIAARIGGDEFIVLLTNELDKDSVLWRCDRLIESVCQPVRFEGGTADVGASIGVAWWPDDALTAKAVIRSADEALYMAKELGRGRTCLAGAPDHRPQSGSNDRNHAA